MLVLTKFVLVVLIATLFSAFVSSVLAYEQFPVQAYGYVPIGTKGSKMYYDLQGDPSATQAQRAQRPTGMFLSGGPCSPGGFPNFVEKVGNQYIEADPSDSSKWILKNSTYTWNKFSNMIFPDSPLGAGWSVVGDQSDYCTTDYCIANNLVTFMKGFLVNHPEFKGTDLYIFGESYSGKIQAFFANALMKSGLDIKVKGASNNDGWTSPIDCMMSYGPWMRANSLVNDVQSEELTDIALQAATQLAKGNGTEATNLWGIQQNAYSVMSAGVNVYNVRFFYDYTAENYLGPFMDTTYRARVNQANPGLISPSKQYNDQSGNCFDYMNPSFMNDGINEMQQLIDSGISVNVWSGALDLIVDTLCTRDWIAKLPWKDLVLYQNAPRQPHSISLPQINGFMQEYKNFRFWSSIDAGHMTPLDQSEYASWMAEYIMSNGTAVNSQRPFKNGAAVKNRRLQELSRKKKRV